MTANGAPIFIFPLTQHTGDSLMGEHRERHARDSAINHAENLDILLSPLRGIPYLPFK